MLPGSDPLEVMRLYAEGWNRYSTATRAVDGVCRYLNKCLRSNFQSAHYSPSTIGSNHPNHLATTSIRIDDEGKDVKLSINSIKDISNNVWKHAFLVYFQKNRGRFNDSNILMDSFLTALRIDSADEDHIKLFIDSFSIYVYLIS